ncbi:hypothetical protein C1E23_03430 [Pseudoalteromonas phenolica]|uniref:DUF4844 domain-containing protein n=1 Tax=Pseudoalteromonas phenolica TaxID=161398 RepID=A0A4Q7IQ95_9GAMM|nr:DUF4844 domain-containing protein [Pseudoalteromonas phenolica]RZQ54484.1 hypothetical protein C1E23_03430 [Pseudoalteromonas phenolica]TMN88889.1 hypothetical protein CWB72_12005 [Pseudoalteromonas phenolica]
MYDPLEDIIDQKLDVSDETVRSLISLSKGDLFSDLPGEIPGEKEMLIEHFQTVIDAIIQGIVANPSKLWVFTIIQTALIEIDGEDTETKEHFGDHIEMIMDVLSIESSDGLLGHYL